MPKIEYVFKKFARRSLAIIAKANEIISEYAAGGDELTLRQLYYQFVSRDIIPNSQREYKNLGSIISDARLAGLIDWHAIIDRTRNLRRNSHWDTPADIIDSAAASFAVDKWKDQPNRIEVWIEKDALVGVISETCAKLDVPYFSCRGYTSQSEMWSAAMRAVRHIEAGKSVTVLHLGDHDPSGMDMTRDIEDRIRMFLRSHDGDDKFSINRLALHKSQVNKYKCPPNPAKLTDARARGYIAEHGRSSWELDALEPKVIRKLVETNVLDLRDDDLWEEAVEKEEEFKEQLREVAGDFRR